MSDAERIKELEARVEELEKSVQRLKIMHVNAALRGLANCDEETDQ